MSYIKGRKCLATSVTAYGNAETSVNVLKDECMLSYNLFNFFNDVIQTLGLFLHP
jgi:hypothetical protein